MEIRGSNPLGGTTHSSREKYGCDRYLLRIRRRGSWWPTQPVMRMPRLTTTLARLGAVLAVCAGAAPVGAAETPVLAQHWDPVAWVIVASGLLIAALAAADAKADRRGH